MMCIYPFHSDDYGLQEGFSLSDDTFSLCPLGNFLKSLESFAAFLFKSSNEVLEVIHGSLNSRFASDQSLRCLSDLLLHLLDIVLVLALLLHFL